MTDAERYETRHPETGAGVEQGAERMQRLDLRDGARRPRVFVVVPALPWIKEAK